MKYGFLFSFMMMTNAIGDCTLTQVANSRVMMNLQKVVVIERYVTWINKYESICEVSIVGNIGEKQYTAKGISPFNPLSVSVDNACAMAIGNARMGIAQQMNNQMIENNSQMICTEKSNIPEVLHENMIVNENRLSFNLTRPSFVMNNKSCKWFYDNGKEGVACNNGNQKWLITDIF